MIPMCSNVMCLLILSTTIILQLRRHVTEGRLQCGNTTTYCPDEGSCCAAQYSPTGFGCVRSAGASCCMPGPELPPSTTLPNCLVIGDSVSIGYTGEAAKELVDVCLLQHGPWDVSDGGAGSTSQGQACLENFLVTQGQESVKWDVILFNFGLHDLSNKSSDEEIYREQLQNITTRLNATGAELLYATTTPFMPYATVGNFVVDQLNDIATEVVGDVASILDLNKLVHDHCGAVYETCDWCRVSPCSYHYNALGETAQAKAVAGAFRTALERRRKTVRA